jgi:hypothetical protein
MFNFIKFIVVVAEQATQIQASEAGATTVASDAVGKDGLSILPSANAVDGGRAAAASPSLLPLAVAADAMTIASDNHDVEPVESVPGEHHVPIAEQQPPIEEHTYANEEDLQYEVNHQIEEDAEIPPVVEEDLQYDVNHQIEEYFPHDNDHTVPFDEPLHDDLNVPEDIEHEGH